MYIDYDRYFYPKVLFSFDELKFPDQFGNSLSIILLQLTSYYKNEYIKENPQYKNCKVWSYDFIKNNIHKYSNNICDDLLECLLSLDIVKHKKETFQIKNKYLNTSDNLITKNENILY